TPAIVDADPQMSIVRRHDPEGALSKLTVVSDPEADSVQATIADLAERHQPVIVDTAGFRNQTTIMAAIVADLVLIPLKPASEDADEAIAMFELINELNQTPERKGRPIMAFMVMTMTTPNAVIVRHVRKELESGGYPLLEAEIAHRVIYPELSIRGLAPSIVDGDSAASRDIARLATEIMKKVKTHGVKAA
ncbi:ParA family protein, partial [Rhizobium brockwellii]|uniref:ParA family protein n=1 Tax=Rhizobium brockwellii TaxID=3019932 RepID=UPI00293DA37B